MIYAIPSKFNMLSNYDDYDYVRDALKNGAVDYVLKHELNKEALLNVIAVAEKQIAVRREENRADNSLALKRNFSMKLISGCYQSVDEIIARANALGMHIATQNIMVVLMQVDRFDNNGIDAHLFEYSILNIVDEILQDAGHGFCCHSSENKYFFLLNLGNTYSAKNHYRYFFELKNK